MSSASFKGTKIVCIIGPATQTPERLRALVQAGMNVCRLNFSHGTHEEHAEFMRHIRAVDKATGEPLTILQDLQGPKIRVGELPKTGVTLKEGGEIIFTTGKATIAKGILPVTYAQLHEDVRPGEMILLDDGLLAMKVKQVKGKNVVCEVINGGLLTSHKGMNLPQTKMNVSSLSDKDREDACFGVEQGVDWMALSFVRSAQDIHELRTLIELHAKKKRLKYASSIRIIAKMEKPEAVTNMDEIIEAADGIMVARGDLGVEIPAEQVPVIQKRLILKCLNAAKPVIVATQMLDSMIRNPRPTRAEVSDIANAVLDHADATMLSGETANGAYPVEAVDIMSRTIRATEKSVFETRVPELRVTMHPEWAMTNLANILARDHQAKAILVASHSGQAARLVSRHRSGLPIFAATSDERTVHQLNLSWGVQAFCLSSCTTVADLLRQALPHLVKQHLIKKGDRLIVVAGEQLGTSGNIDLVELRTV